MKKLGFLLKLKSVVLASLFFNVVHADSLSLINADSNEIIHLKK